MSDSESKAEVGSLIGSRTLQRKTKEVLDYIHECGEPIVILRNGRPAAALVPIDEDEAKTMLLAAAVRERRVATPAGDNIDEPLFAVSEREAVSGEAAIRMEGESAISMGVGKSLADIRDELEVAVEAVQATLADLNSVAERKK